MQWMISINQLGAQQARILDDISKLEGYLSS
jgi:hypothetical protein